MFQEHPTPECPVCEGERTRVLDDEWATCFHCDNDWAYEEDYSDYWDEM